MSIFWYIFRGGSRAAETSKMERFVIIVNGFQPFITKRSILDVAAALDPPLILQLSQRILRITTVALEITTPHLEQKLL